MRDSNKKIVNERIKILFEEAEKNSDYSNRYVYLARKLSMRYNVKIPKLLKIKFCKNCYNYLNSKNSIVRTNPKTRTIDRLCLSCKTKSRVGYRV